MAILDFLKSAATAVSNANKAASSSSTTKSSVSNVSTSGSSQKSIQDQMAANSAAWHTASASEKLRLQAENQKLANNMAAAGNQLSFNSGTGTWSNASTSSGSTGTGGGGGGTTTSTPTSSVAGVTATNAAQQAILDRMAANSAAWHTANASERARLEAANQNYASQLAAMGMNLGFDSGSGMWSGGAVGGVAPTTGNVTNPSLNGLPLGDMYGLTYDYDKILGLLNKATTDAYAAREQESKQAENTFYKNLMDTQSTTLDTLRQAQAAAVATGASRGIAAANELSAILGMQEGSTDEANLLANATQNLAGEKQADMSKNASSALDTSNAIKQAIANMDLTKYGYDVQKLLGDLDYLASLYNADRTLEGVKYNADSNLAGTQYAANNQPVYNSNSGGSWSGGSGSGGGSTGGGSNTTGNQTTTPTGQTGGSLTAQSLDSAIQNGGGSAQLTGTRYMVKAGDNGTYAISDGSGAEGTAASGLTWQQVQKIQNNNDINAYKPSYGVDTLLNALQSKTVTVSNAKYVWDGNTKTWLNTSKPGEEIYRFVPGTVDQNNADGILSRNPTAVTRQNSDGTISILASKPGDSKATDSILSFVKQGSIPNGMTITLSGANKYTYNAATGTWRSNLAGGVSMNTMLDTIRKASTVQIG